MLGFFSPGPVELAIIAGILLLLFGNRLPSLMRSLGRGVVEFKAGLHGSPEDDEESEQLGSNSGKKESEKINAE